MMKLFQYKVLTLPLGIYVIPIILFLIIAAASYQNSVLHFSHFLEKNLDNEPPEVFEKAKPNWAMAIFVSLVLSLVFFVIDLAFSIK